MTQLATLAKRITNLNKAHDSTVVFEVRVTSVISLGYDKGAKVTAKDLENALWENLCEWMQQCDPEGALDHVEIIEARDE
jgi:hypothetical protein